MSTLHRISLFELSAISLMIVVKICKLNDFILSQQLDHQCISFACNYKTSSKIYSFFNPNTSETQLMLAILQSVLLSYSCSCIYSWTQSRRSELNRQWSSYWECTNQSSVNKLPAHKYMYCVLCFIK